jgi:hypothetical protein
MWFVTAAKENGFLSGSMADFLAVQIVSFRQNDL